MIVYISGGHSNKMQNYKKTVKNVEIFVQAIKFASSMSCKDCQGTKKRRSVLALLQHKVALALLCLLILRDLLQSNVEYFLEPICQRVYSKDARYFFKLGRSSKNWSCKIAIYPQLLCFCLICHSTLRFFPQIMTVFYFKRMLAFLLSFLGLSEENEK